MSAEQSSREASSGKDQKSTLLIGVIALALVVVATVILSDDAWFQVSVLSAALVVSLGLCLYLFQQQQDALAQEQYCTDLNARVVALEREIRSRDKYFFRACHDLRQPLAALSLYLELLEQHVDEDGKSLLNPSLESTQSLSQMFDNLVEVTRIDAGEWVANTQVVRLSDALSLSLQRYQESAEQKSLSYSVNLSNHAVSVDLALLTRILHHYIDNAIKFTDHGQVLVSSELRAALPSCVVISVRDTAQGLSEGQANDLLKARDWRGADAVHSGSHGMGLGLVIVQKLAEMSSLEVGCDANLHGGLSFWVAVPMVDESFHHGSL